MIKLFNIILNICGQHIEYNIQCPQIEFLDQKTCFNVRVCVAQCVCARARVINLPSSARVRG